MPKYYVQSGQIKCIIGSTDHRSAIIAVIKKYKGKGLLTVAKICISETGWSKDLTCYDTDGFLKDLI
jgi:hypothetical protein